MVTCTRSRTPPPSHHTLTCCSTTCCIGVAKLGKTAVSRTEVLVMFVASRVGGRAHVIAESSAGDLECTLLRVTTCMCGIIYAYETAQDIYIADRYIYNYLYIYEHEATQKPISENNITNLVWYVYICIYMYLCCFNMSVTCL